MTNRERAVDYLNTRERLYVIDAFGGADPKYRLKVRVITSRAYHALFMHNMLIRPTEDELMDFGDPDFTSTSKYLIVFCSSSRSAILCLDLHHLNYASKRK
mmetsp:Transcript_13910/g.19318  ORF Transcript_13910/g.19318 Transcript_13910/m.19318 type:complete len:101 (-) Transcript_13910:1711-2013(-)